MKTSSSLLPNLRLVNLRLVVPIALVMGWCASGMSQADTIQYNVSFNDPNAFQFDPNGGPYALDFFLTAGSGTTTVSGSNFNGSGTSAATNFTFNNSTGDVEVPRTFTPPTSSPAGSLLSFDIFADYTPGGTESFSFGIYKNFGTGNQNLIVTNEQPLQQSFFTIDFSNPGGPSVASYGSNDAGFNIGAPTLTTIGAVATPEPETWVMMMMGLGTLGLLGYKRKNAAVAS